MLNLSVEKQCIYSFLQLFFMATQHLGQGYLENKRSVPFPAQKANVVLPLCALPCVYLVLAQ